MAKSTAIVLKGYPRLSETFIAQEIRELEKRGLPITLVSLRHPTDTKTHPIHHEIKAPVNYLPEYLYRAPMRVWRAWSKVRNWRGYKKAYGIWRRDWQRDRTANRVRRFGQALVLAHELPDDIEHLHAHFLHTPASVTRYAALISGRTWSCSAHAVDIWTSPTWEISEKLADCQWLATCTKANCDYLSSVGGNEDKIHLAYHGLDLDRFPEDISAPNDRVGDPDQEPVYLLSVGRAVEKKGYPDLLAALSRLPETLNWRLIHIGGGALTGELQKLAQEMSIADRIEWLGSRSQGEVLEQYRKADIFVLASRVAQNGDRDGLPNVLMEAQSQSLPCVSTRVSAIPELIEDGVTGLLVEQGDIEGLADSLNRLIKNPGDREKLGRAGNDLLRRNFAFSDCMEKITSLFELETV